VKNFLVRIAQADSYALACEYIEEKGNEKLIKKLLNFEGYQSHPTYHKTLPGHYSDDTQMSIAVSEYLIDKLSCPEKEPEPIINYFFRAFKRDPIDGYSRYLQSLLEESSTVEELFQGLTPDSDSNGAAMRSVPIGLLPNLKEAIEFSTSQAKVTHNSKGGILSSNLVTAMSHYFRYTNCYIEEIIPFLNEKLTKPKEMLNLFRQFIESPWSGRLHKSNVRVYNVNGSEVSGIGLATAHAVFTLLSHKKNLKDMMSQVIEWGGDTDSVASIAWGIAALRYEGEELPKFFDEKLRNDEFGTRYLLKLGSEIEKLTS